MSWKKKQRKNFFNVQEMFPVHSLYWTQRSLVSSLFHFNSKRKKCGGCLGRCLSHFHFFSIRKFITLRFLIEKCNVTHVTQTLWMKNIILRCVPSKEGWKWVKWPIIINLSVKFFMNMSKIAAFLNFTTFFC